MYVLSLFSEKYSNIFVGIYTAEKKVLFTYTQYFFSNNFQISANFSQSWFTSQEYSQTKLQLQLQNFILCKIEGVILNEIYAEFSTAGPLTFLILRSNTLLLRDSLQRH